MKNVLFTKDAPAAIGPYSQGISAGNMVFVSGQLPVVPETGEMLTGDMAQQTTQCLKNLESILQNAGCTLENVVKTTIFLKDLNDFAIVNQAYGAAFAKEPPARSCVEVARLPKDGRIEIEAIAVK